MPPKNRIPRTFALAVLLLFSFPCGVFSGFSGPMRFSIYRPCAGNIGACESEVLAEGVIEHDTADKFLKFIAANDKFPYYLASSHTVCFDSPGGDLRGAIKLGEIIREHEYHTCLSRDYRRVPEKEGGMFLDLEVFRKDAICASACIFALAGGVNRSVDEKSRLGVHQFSGAQGPIGDGNTQVTLVALAAYLDKMGVKRELLDIASLVPPDQIHWLSPQEIKSSRIDNTSMIPSEWQLETTANGDIFAQISQEDPYYHRHARLLLMKKNNGAVLVVAVEPVGKVDKEVVNAFNNECLWVEIDGNKVAYYERLYWKQTGKMFTTSMSLSPQVIQALRTGKKIWLSTMVPPVYNVLPSLDFPLEGLARLLPAIFK